MGKCGILYECRIFLYKYLHMCEKCCTFARSNSIYYEKRDFIVSIGVQCGGVGGDVVV